MLGFLLNYINVVPQLEITNVVNVPTWQQFSFNFTADSAYKFITIGNFRPDASTTKYTFNSGGSITVAYYYIDDVSVVDVTGVQDYDYKNQISIYPSPASDFVNVNYSNKNNTELTLNIYNLIGGLVKSEQLQDNQKQINVEDLNNGVYLVEIKSKDWTGKQKLIIQR